MKSDQKYFYIPLEIYRRELTGMMILALVAAKNGWNVVLGGKRAIMPFLNKLPEGVVLTKSIVPGEYENMKKIKDEGHRIVSLDAEGLVIVSGKMGAYLRYSNRTISISDMLFFWGKNQYLNTIKYFPEAKKIGHITGSPVFDFWRYQKLSFKQKDKNKRKTVLIATSFIHTNHVISQDMAKRLLIDALSKSVGNTDYLEEFFKVGNLQKEVFPLFVDLVKQLFERYPDVDFIFRPHIAENPKTWADMAKGYSNVRMNLTGEISSVLVESDVIIHFNSTTAIEAYYFDKKVITYVPKAHISPELYEILNKEVLTISKVCETPEDVFREIESDEPMKTDGESPLADIIQEPEITTPYRSSMSIVNALENLQSIEVTRKFPSVFGLMMNPKMLKAELKLRTLWAVGWIDHLTHIFRGKYATSKDIFKYGATKQGKLDPTHILALSDKMIRDFGFENENIKIKEIKNGMLFISKEPIKTSNQHRHA